MKIALMGYRRVRDGIAVSIVFVGMGVALMVVASLLVAELAYFPAVLTGLGLLLLAIAAVILVASLLRHPETAQALASSRNSPSTVGRIDAT